MRASAQRKADVTEQDSSLLAVRLPLDFGYASGHVGRAGEDKQQVTGAVEIFGQRVCNGCLSSEGHQVTFGLK